MDKDKVKRWYEWKMWTKEMVSDAVKKGKLKAEDYKYITGEDYIEY